jgi:transposase-like protein
MKYTIKQLRAEFGTDAKCLQFVFDNRYGKDFTCPNCKATGRFYPIESRKRFDCVCGFTVSPLAGTIFHKSSTPLTLWFHAIFLFASSRNGVSAKELERQLGVTYKTAWRLAKQIRILFAQANNPLSGVVEADETYMGGKRQGKRGRGAENKTPVFGIVERKGRVKAEVVESIRIKTIQPIIDSSVIKGTTIMTDEFNVYNRVKQSGYDHQTVQHGLGEYVRGLVHSNSIEGFWSQLKRSINGTHHAISKKYLQLYVDEFVYRYNYRGQALFPLMLATAVKPVSRGYERTFS